jgi:hypothetical protein
LRRSNDLGERDVVDRDNVVGRNGDDLGVAGHYLRIEGCQLEMLQVVLWAEVTAREHENHWGVALQGA